MAKTLKLGESIEDDDDFLKELGRIAVRASAMERVLCLFTIELLNPSDEEIGKARIAGMKFSEIATLFETELVARLAAHPDWSNTWRTLVRKTVRGMKRAYEQRSGVMHASFTPEMKLNKSMGPKSSHLQIVFVSHERAEGWSGQRHRRANGFWSERRTLGDLRVISTKIRKADIAFFEAVRDIAIAFDGTFPLLARAMFSREWD